MLGLSIPNRASLNKTTSLSVMLFWVLFTVIFIPGCGQSKPVPDLFSLPISYKVGKKPAGLKAQDMNQDGFPDIIVCNSASNTLSYFEAIGDGTFKKSL